jgi:hypothetical protein
MVSGRLGASNQGVLPDRVKDEIAHIMRWSNSHQPGRLAEDFCFKGLRKEDMNDA